MTITYVQDGRFEHPMHLNGHAFTVLSTNGTSWNAVVLKGTDLLPPHGTVVIRFLADNPGVWMVPCHELHHAEAGMIPSTGAGRQVFAHVTTTLLLLSA